MKMTLYTRSPPVAARKGDGNHRSEFRWQWRAGGGEELLHDLLPRACRSGATWGGYALLAFPTVTRFVWCFCIGAVGASQPLKVFSGAGSRDGGAAARRGHTAMPRAANCRPARGVERPAWPDNSIGFLPASHRIRVRSGGSRPPTAPLAKRDILTQAGAAARGRGAHRRGARAGAARQAGEHLKRGLLPSLLYHWRVLPYQAF